MNINCRPVQQQTGTLDCGLSTIACAVGLCKGNDPVDVKFSQNEMRYHLIYISCLQMGKFESFSRMKRRIKQTQMKDEYMIYAVYCFCRYPDIYDKKMPNVNNGTITHVLD